VQNRDDTAEEFDSKSLKVEKVIAGRGEAVVRLRRLDPGTYPFIGEYHSNTCPYRKLYPLGLLPRIAR
jgi:hypothetical protein